MRPPRKIDDTRLLELHNSGMSQTDISKEFGCSQYAISKRLKRLLPPPLLKVDNLTVQQANFAERVASGMSPTNAALETYNCTSRDSAKQIGKKLMQLDDVKSSIEELMNGYGLTRGYKVRKLRQHVDHPDAALSLKALDIAFKLTGDGSPQEIKMTTAADIRLLIASLPDVLPEPIEIEAETVSAG